MTRQNNVGDWELALDDLLDVDLTGIVDNYILRYNSTTGLWGPEALGAPSAHKDSHDPEDGSDPLDTAAPANLDGVQAAATGTSHSFARADHTHRIQAAIADNAIVTIDHATPVDNDYAKFTANGLEGRSYSEVRTDLDIVGRDIALVHTANGVNVAVGDGVEAFPVPLSMNGWKLSDVMTVVDILGVGSTMNTQVRKASGGADVDMLSSLVTHDPADYYENDGVVKSDGSEIVSTGDNIYVDIDQVHTTPAQGCGIVLTFVRP